MQYLVVYPPSAGGYCLINQGNTLVKGTGSAIFWYFFDDFSLKQNILYVIVLTKGCVMASYCARVVNGTVRLIHINNFMVATKKL